MSEMSVLLQSGFATLVLEAIKWVLYVPFTWAVRKLFKAPEFVLNIPIKVYLVLLTILNFLAGPVLALAGFEGFVIPTDWLEFTRELARLLIQTLISVWVYNQGLKPTKEAIANE
jgi:hypothetical protein